MILGSGTVSEWNCAVRVHGDTYLSERNGVVRARIAEDQSHVSTKLLWGLVLASMQLLQQGTEVHRPLDDVKIILKHMSCHAFT